MRETEEEGACGGVEEEDSDVEYVRGFDPDETLQEADLWEEGTQTKISIPTDDLNEKTLIG